MRPMKLLVQLEDYQCFQLKKLSLASLSESGNSGLKLNKTLKAHNSWQEYARTKMSESQTKAGNQEKLQKFENLKI